MVCLGRTSAPSGSSSQFLDADAAGFHIVGEAWPRARRSRLLGDVFNPSSMDRLFPHLCARAAGASSSSASAPGIPQGTPRNFARAPQGQPLRRPGRLRSSSWSASATAPRRGEEPTGQAGRLRSLYETTPTPADLVRWSTNRNDHRGGVAIPGCELADARDTTKPVQGLPKSCPKTAAGELVVPVLSRMSHRPGLDPPGAVGFLYFWRRSLFENAGCSGCWSSPSSARNCQPTRLVRRGSRTPTVDRQGWLRTSDALPRVKATRSGVAGPLHRIYLLLCRRVRLLLNARSITTDDPTDADGNCAPTDSSRPATSEFL